MTRCSQPCVHHGQAGRDQLSPPPVAVTSVSLGGSPEAPGGSSQADTPAHRSRLPDSEQGLIPRFVPVPPFLRCKGGVRAFLPGMFR